MTSKPLGKSFRIKDGKIQRVVKFRSVSARIASKKSPKRKFRPAGKS